LTIPLLISLKFREQEEIGAFAKSEFKPSVEVFASHAQTTPGVSLRGISPATVLLEFIPEEWLLAVAKALKFIISALYVCVEKRHSNLLLAPSMYVLRKSPTLTKSFQAKVSLGTLRCVDESLMAFKGTCPFKQFIKRKPHPSIWTEISAGRAGNGNPYCYDYLLDQSSKLPAGLLSPQCPPISHRF